MINRLEVTEYGQGAGVPLLIAHGLFGSARNWRALARSLARNRHVLVVDMRNHGASFWSETNSYFDLADDLAAVIKDFGGVADVLGHSMGGKAAMVLALNYPSAVGRLIVGDIAPLPYAHSQTPNIRAMQSVPLHQITRRSEAEAFLSTSVEDPRVVSFLAQSLEVSESGLSWKINLSSLARNMDEIIGFPEVSARFDGPALSLNGALSDYVLPKDHTLMKTLFPSMQFQVIENAGHWLHADNPRAFIAAVETFLSET